MSKHSNRAGLGIALGAALGAVAGAIAGNIGVWLAIGVAVGMALGMAFRRSEPPCPECAEIHRGHEIRNQHNKLGARS
jgi:hypothetical protein